MRQPVAGSAAGWLRGSASALNRGNLADSMLDAAQLPEMVADVNHVEAAPLVGAQGPEDEV